MRRDRQVQQLAPAVRSAATSAAGASRKALPARRGILPAVIYLIGGPPRTGKTLLARRLGRRLGIGWLSLDTVRFVLRDLLPDDKRHLIEVVVIDCAPRGVAGRNSLAISGPPAPSVEGG